jgi:hypothetical protein
MIGGCASDPFVVLSNGATVHLDAVLPNTPIGDLQSVSYTLVIPAGTTVVQQVNTDGVVGTKEQFQYSATNSTGAYRTSTLVQTLTTGDPVTATTSISIASASIGTVGASIEIASDSVNGQVNQPLVVQLQL